MTDSMKDHSDLAREVEEWRADSVEYCRELASEKWIRVMCDYAADGVWTKGGGSTAPHYLPISIALIARILAWQAVYETFEPWDRPVDIQLFERWGQEGLLIAIELKRQLPDWAILYHDGRRTPPWPGIERYRPWFEYEITNNVVRTGLPPDNYPK